MGCLRSGEAHIGKLHDAKGKFAFLCEGSNDVLVVKSIIRQLMPDGVFAMTKQLGGVNRLLKEAVSVARKLIAKGYVVVVVYDEADEKDDKAIEELEGPSLIVAPAKRKIEAWLLADGDAVYRASGLTFRGPFPTDLIEDPKYAFLHHFHRAVREGKRSYIFRERDFFKATLLYWDVGRARQHNESLDKLCKKIDALKR